MSFLAQFRYLLFRLFKKNRPSARSATSPMPAFISKDSFLRTVPLALGIKDRLVFEGATCAISSIAWSFERLKAVAAEIADEPPEILTLADEQGIFVNCWSIVDQCHMLRTLLRNLPLKAGGEIESFIEKYEAMTTLRNQMDHLPSLLNNLAAEKQPHPPVFGVFSFAAVDEKDMSLQADGSIRLKGCRTITVTAGSLTHPNHRFDLPNPAGRIIELPIGMFVFNSGKVTVNFSDLIADLRHLVSHFDTSIRNSVETGVRAAAKKHGLNAEKLLAEHGGGVKLEVHVEFED